MFEGMMTLEQKCSLALKLVGDEPLSVRTVKADPKKDPKFKEGDAAVVVSFSLALATDRLGGRGYRVYGRTVEEALDLMLAYCVRISGEHVAAHENCAKESLQVAEKWRAIATEILST